MRVGGCENEEVVREVNRSGGKIQEKYLDIREPGINR